MLPREHYTFTRKERNGIFVFFVLALFFMYGLPAIFKPGDRLSEAVLAKEFDISDTLDYRGLDAESADGTESDFVRGGTVGSFTYYNNKRPREKFAFNPNNVGMDSLLRLGFSKFASNNLINYRNKGGRIYDLDKLKSIYGMDQALIEELREFIVFDVQPVAEKKEPPEKPEFTKNKIATVELHFVELNGADTTELMKLKGIGRYKATRIIEYRQRLGGFLDVSQLREIPQIEDSLYYELEPFLSVNPELIQKTDLNAADYRTLIRHPYMTKEAVNLILNYRKQHGPYKKPEEIKRIRAFKEDFVNKILPYIKADNPVVQQEGSFQN